MLRTATADWVALAEHPALTVVMDVDDTILQQAPLDNGMVLLLDALHETVVHVVFLSALPMQQAGRIRSQASHVEWIGKRRGHPASALTARLRERTAGVRLIAIGDASADDTVLAALAPDRSILVRADATTEVPDAHDALVVPRPTAIRAMLWWLVETRRQCALSIPGAVLRS